MVPKVRPSTSSKLEGSHNWNSRRNEFISAKEKPLKAKKQADNLKPLDGEMDKTTQNMSEYGKNGLFKRPENLRPLTSNKPEGKHTWSTGKNDFTSAEGQERTEKTRPLTTCR